MTAATTDPQRTWRARGIFPCESRVLSPAPSTCNMSRKHNNTFLYGNLMCRNPTSQCPRPRPCAAGKVPRRAGHNACRAPHCSGPATPSNRSCSNGRDPILFYISSKFQIPKRRTGCAGRPCAAAGRGLPWSGGGRQGWPSSRPPRLGLGPPRPHTTAQHAAQSSRHRHARSAACLHGMPRQRRLRACPP